MTRSFLRNSEPGEAPVLASNSAIDHGCARANARILRSDADGGAVSRIAHAAQ